MLTIGPSHPQFVQNSFSERRIDSSGRCHCLSFASNSIGLSGVQVKGVESNWWLSTGRPLDAIGLRN
jgi:hypothetical protein